MIIGEKQLKLFNIFYENVLDVSKEKIIEMLKNELKENINVMDSLLNSDLKNLNDDNFYNLISSMYHITLEEEDHLKIISKKMNKKCMYFTDIETSMTFTDTATEGRGKDFSWWQQLYQIEYTVGVFKGCNIDSSSIFSKKDIRKMIDEKNIIIIDIKSVPLDYEPDFKEEVEHFSLYDYKFDDEINKNEDFSIIISILRKKFTKKRILKDIRYQLEELSLQINEILDFYSDPNPFYSNTSLLIGEWFKNSEEKKEYVKLLEKTNNKK